MNIESEINNLEKRFINGLISDKEYDQEIDILINQNKKPKCTICGENSHHSLFCQEWKD